jgi:hypothetical protein
MVVDIFGRWFSPLEMTGKTLSRGDVGGPLERAVFKVWAKLSDFSDPLLKSLCKLHDTRGPARYLMIEDRQSSTGIYHRAPRILHYRIPSDRNIALLRDTGSDHNDAKSRNYRPATYPIETYSEHSAVGVTATSLKWSELGRLFSTVCSQYY